MKKRQAPRSTLAAYQLFHRGMLALSQIEHNGIAIDREYLDQALADNYKEINRLENKLCSTEVFATWERHFDRPNLASRAQLGEVLFGILRFPGGSKTEHNQYRTDEESLELVNHEFVTDWVLCARLKKTGDFLKGIQREVTDRSLIHPSISLNTARTFRSSCTNPNFQNQPVRNPKIAETVRTCVVPRAPGRMIAEVDLSGAEVRCSACYHHDPQMITYIEDKTTDMHRDMAAQIYKLKPNQVSKQARYAAKNMYVFPEFYGSYYMQCAINLWQSLDKLKLCIEGTTKPIKQHLAKQGIHELGSLDPKAILKTGTFTAHLKQVEQDFWERRFKIYHTWKNVTWEAYQKWGWNRMKTGFVYSGPLTRNDVLNYPIQGSAFHWLLWSLIQLQKWLLKNKYKTKIIMEIHDSLLLDVYEPELNIVLRKAKQIMTEQVREHWPWICVPLEVEAEVAPVGKSWFEKKPVIIE